MTHKLEDEMKNVLGDVGNILCGERPTTHGDIADFAGAFGSLHGAYIAAVMTSGRQANSLDSYAVQIIQKLARIANGAPEHSDAHFIDIAGYAVAATAHVRKAAEAQAAAQKAQAERMAQEGVGQAQAADPRQNGQNAASEAPSRPNEGTRPLGGAPRYVMKPEDEGLTGDEPQGIVRKNRIGPRIED